MEAELSDQTYSSLEEHLRDILDDAGIHTFQYERVPRISTGSMLMDWAFNGGWPCGRFSMLWGEESSGKTTSTLLAIAALHANDPYASAAFIDAEGLNMEWVERLGIDMSRFVVITNPRVYDSGPARGMPMPMTTEMALNTLEALIEMKRFSIIVLDSVPALASQAEMKGEIGDHTIAANARLYRDFFNRNTTLVMTAGVATGYVDKATGEVHRPRTEKIAKTSKYRITSGIEGSPPAILFTNQVRENIGVMYGPTERMPGGRSVRHAQSLIVRTYKPKMDEIFLNGDGDIEGIQHRGKIIKSKVGPMTREYEVVVRHSEDYVGFDIYRECAALALKLNAFTSSSGDVYSSGNPYLDGKLLDFAGITLDSSIKSDKTMHKINVLMSNNEMWRTEIYRKVRSLLDNVSYTVDWEVWDEIDVQ